MIGICVPITYDRSLSAILSSLIPISRASVFEEKLLCENTLTFKES